MNIETAQALLNNPDYVSAYADWNRQPMQTSEEVFKRAMDWAEAALFVSAHQR